MKELEKAHRAGLIHNDIKMRNILINKRGLNSRWFYDVQLIDWNESPLYYRGVDNLKPVHVACYYAPEKLFSAMHFTPAIDVWALGVVMFMYYTDRNPFEGVSCRV